MQFAVVHPHSVISGTMRLADTLPAVIAELASLATSRELRDWVCEAQARAGDLDLISETEPAHELFIEVCDRLDELAGPGLYFGAHWGDGADLGFWPQQGDVE